MDENERKARKWCMTILVIISAGLFAAFPVYSMAQAFIHLSLLCLGLPLLSNSFKKR